MLGRMFNNSLNAVLDKSLLNKYLDLPQPDNKIQAEYIWIDGTGKGLRSKTRTINYIPGDSSELPFWTYDCSSTYQAHGENSGIILRPVAIYKDPFRRNNNILVLCETYNFDKTPIATNERLKCKEAMDNPTGKKDKPWFGIEQNCTFVDMDGWLLGRGFPQPKGSYCPYHCGVGADKVIGRPIVEAHYRACLYAGIEISSSNAGAVPSQWKYQIGSSEGISAGNGLWVSRFILLRIAEEYGVVVKLDPTPMEDYGKDDEWLMTSNPEISIFNDFSVVFEDECASHLREELENEDS